MISDRIREARQRKGVSMRQAAIEMGFPYTTYVNYEKGVSEPNSEALVKIAVYYKVSTDYLVGVNKETLGEEAELYDNTIQDDALIILNRNAKKLSPENRKKLLDVARAMFKEEFND